MKKRLWKKEKGQHLSWNDRLVIKRMLLAKARKDDIALAIGCSRATIYNEIKRATYVHTNPDLTVEVRYSPDIAQQRYEYHLKRKGSVPKILKDPKLCNYIKVMILQYKYSPYAVLCAIKKFGHEFSETIKSVNTLYSAIDKGYIQGVSRQNLPTRRHKQKRKSVPKAKRLPAGASIEQRPQEVLDRETFGHWEMDTVVGKTGGHKSILALTERKTRYEFLLLLPEHTTLAVQKALNRLERALGASFYKIFKTITCDNGCEFADFKGIEKAYRRKGERTKLFYCHPRAPAERGSNEVANRLIRRFLPKGTSFQDITVHTLSYIQDWINEYPRGIFNGKTSLEMFNNEVVDL